MLGSYLKCVNTSLWWLQAVMEQNSARRKQVTGRLEYSKNMNIYLSIQIAGNFRAKESMTYGETIETLVLVMYGVLQVSKNSTIRTCFKKVKPNFLHSNISVTQTSLPWS